MPALARKRISKGYAILAAVTGAILVSIAYTFSRDQYMPGGLSQFLFICLVTIGWIGLFVCMVGLAEAIGKMVNLVPGLAFTTMGYFSAYYWGYKNDFFIFGSSLICVLIGSFALIFVLFSRGMIKGHAWKAVLLFVLLLLSIFVFIAISFKSEERMANMLQTQPTHNTIGTITRLKEYSTYSKTGGSRRHSDALLEFVVDNKIRYKVVDNSNGQYLAGTRLEVKYLLECPDMFQIIQTVQQ